MVGARVVGTQSGAGGYSPSFASRCDLDDGRRVFVKAVSPAQNPESPDMLRSEIDVTRRLPSSVAAPATAACRWTTATGSSACSSTSTVDRRAPHGSRASCNGVRRGRASSATDALTDALRAARRPPRSPGDGVRRLATIRRTPAPVRSTTGHARTSTISSSLEVGLARRGRAATRSSISTSAATTSSSSRPVASSSSTGRTTCIGAPWFDLRRDAPVDRARRRR